MEIEIRGKLAIIDCRIFCLPVCYPKILKIKIYRTIILPVVLYGYETWLLTLREDIGRGCFRIGC